MPILTKEQILCAGSPVATASPPTSAWCIPARRPAFIASPARFEHGATIFRGLGVRGLPRAPMQTDIRRRRYPMVALDVRQMLSAELQRVRRKKTDTLF